MPEKDLSTRRKIDRHPNLKQDDDFAYKSERIEKSTSPTIRMLNEPDI